LRLSDGKAEAGDKYGEDETRGRIHRRSPFNPLQTCTPYLWAAAGVFRSPPPAAKPVPNQSMVR
jgi:hypothetical protein